MKDLALAYEIRRKSRAKPQQLASGGEVESSSMNMDASTLAAQIRAKKKLDSDPIEEVQEPEYDLDDFGSTDEIVDNDEKDPKRARLSKILSK